MSTPRRRALGLLMLVALVLVLATFHDSFASIARKWTEDASFSHGFLIVPVALWLAWRKRPALAQVPVGPSWLGVAALLCCCAVWITARGAGVLVIEQLAVVAMIGAMVLAVLGRAATQVLIFPLAFLVFAVPFGRAIVPWLMHLTADLSTVALQWSGVPVLRSHMYISIPGGSFEVARACSGLGFAVTGLVLGVLYAHVGFQSWTKRAICVAAFVVIPIFANGLRVYFTILMSYLTDMRFGPGAEHVTFGRVFFIAVLFATFWIARRWHDETPLVEHVPGPSAVSTARLPTMAWAPVPLAFLVVLLTPSSLASSLASSRARLADASRLAALPHGAGGWEGPTDGAEVWRPLFHGGLTERQGAYRGADGSVVGAFVAVYGLGASEGAEMISYGNILFPEDQRSLAEVVSRRVTLPDGSSFRVREVETRRAGSSRLVWYWFMVGDRPATQEFVVKALEAAAFVMRTADSERIVTLSTTLDDSARDRLRDFIAAHAQCVRAGFTAQACGG